MARTHSLSTNRYGVNSFVVSTTAANGDYTTLASAMADASSGDTIFLRDSVTENVTITPGVNIAAWSGGTLNVPSITGTLTMTGAGTSTISGLRLVTNGASLISVTGSAASILNVNNCFLSMGSDGITFSSSSSSAKITLFNCLGDLTTTGIKIFAHSSSGRLIFTQSNIQNTGASTTASTISAGTIELNSTLILSPITTSGSTCLYAASYSQINCNAINTTALTHGCTNATASASQFGIYSSGTASAISISASCSFTSLSDLIGSNNTNAVTGSGTITISQMNFFGSSNTVNTTTVQGAVSEMGITRSKTQPAFLAQSTLQSDQTGDGTLYGVTFTTEIFDQNSNYASPTFTAPYTGRYYLGTILGYSGLGAGNTSGFTFIITSNRNYAIGGNPANQRNSGNAYTESFSVLADMDVGDTASVSAQISGGTKVVDLPAGSSFYGNLEV